MPKTMKVTDCAVSEGLLYEVMGEDEMLTCYDLVVCVWDDKGAMWKHKHVFKGSFRDEIDGMMRPNYAAKPNAHDLCERVKKAGWFNPVFWEYYGHEDEYDEYGDEERAS